MRISKRGMASFFVSFFLTLFASAAGFKMGMPIPEDSAEWELAEGIARQMAECPAGKMKLELVPREKNGLGQTSQLKAGTLDCGIVTMTDFNELSLGQDAFAYAVPFTFKSTNEIDGVRAVMDADLLGRLSEGPYEALGIVEFGFAYAMSTKELGTPEDWRSRKIWIPADVDMLSALRMIGLETVVTPVEAVPEDLKSGKTDTVIAMPVGMVMKRWHRRVANAFLLPVVYTYGIMVARDESVERLSADEKRNLREHVASLCRDLNTAIRARNGEAWEVMSRRGVKLVEPDAAMRGEWMSWADRVWGDETFMCRPTVEVGAKVRAVLAPLRIGGR